MGSRPLRQYYDEKVDIEVDDDLGRFTEAWVRHRRRFVEGLSTLSDEQWTEQSRCANWNVQDVVSHLTTADSFWVLSLRSAVAGSPTSFLSDFNPTDSPEAIVAPMRSMPADAVLEQFRESTDGLIETVLALDDGAWSVLAESPFGHVPARFLFAHAHWDSWLHERDVFLPLGIDVPVESDELAPSTWFSLVFGAVQGGLLDDPDPVGPGLSEPIDVSLAFTDLPGLPLRLIVDEGVRAERGGPDAVTVGAALDFVETYTGRRSKPLDGALPTALDAQLQRAMQIL